MQHLRLANEQIEGTKAMAGNVSAEEESARPTRQQIKHHLGEKSSRWGEEGRGEETTTGWYRKRRPKKKVVDFDVIRRGRAAKRPRVFRMSPARVDYSSSSSIQFDLLLTYDTQAVTPNVKPLHVDGGGGVKSRGGSSTFRRGTLECRVQQTQPASFCRRAVRTRWKYFRSR